MNQRQIKDEPPRAVVRKRLGDAAAVLVDGILFVEDTGDHELNEIAIAAACKYATQHVK